MGKGYWDDASSKFLLINVAIQLQDAIIPALWLLAVQLPTFLPVLTSHAIYVLVSMPALWSASSTADYFAFSYLSVCTLEFFCKYLEQFQDIRKGFDRAKLVQATQLFLLVVPMQSQNHCRKATGAQSSCVIRSNHRLLFWCSAVPIHNYVFGSWIISTEYPAKTLNCLYVSAGLSESILGTQVVRHSFTCMTHFSSPS